MSNHIKDDDKHNELPICHIQENMIFRPDANVVMTRTYFKCLRIKVKIVTFYEIMYNDPFITKE